MAEELESMSDEEFEQAWTQAAEELQEAKDKVKAYSDEAERRAAKARFDDMSEGEKRAFAQYIETYGVESREAVLTGDEE